MKLPIHVARHRHRSATTAVLAAVASLALAVAIAVGLAPSAGAEVSTDITTADGFVASDAPTAVEDTSWISMDASPTKYGYFKFHVSVPDGEVVTHADFKCWAGSSTVSPKWPS